MAHICTICKKEMAKTEYVDSVSIGGDYYICPDCKKYIDIKNASVSNYEKYVKLIEVSCQYEEESWLKNYYEITAEKIKTVLSEQEINQADDTLRQMLTAIATEDINKPVYSLDGSMGRHLDIFENKVVLKVKTTIGSLLTGNVTDGEKIIYYSDCIGLQYKLSGFTIGYIQFETASGLMNNKASNFFNENTFTWDSSVSNLTNEKMEEVVQYCKNKIDEYKSGNKHQGTQSISIADEIFKLKSLLDSGAITEEEYSLLKDKIIKTC